MKASSHPSILFPQKEPGLEAQVGVVIGKTLPNLLRIERFLSLPALVAVVLTLLSLGGLGVWAAKIVWEDTQKTFIAATVKDLQERADGPMAQLARMGESLNTTFKSQVDSGTFKVLKFGCTPPGQPPVTGIAPCSLNAAQQFRAQEDQSILFVANPQHQLVRLDVSVYPIDKTERLEPLLLQLFAETPSIGANGSGTGNGRVRLPLQPRHVISGGAGSLLQNGLLRVVTPSGMLQASLDLTDLLNDKSFVGPIQLRFTVLRLRPRPAAHGLNDETSLGDFEPARGTELFFLRTITSAYHSIGGFKKASLP